MMRQMRELWDNAPTNPKMDGARVRLPGYVVPLEEVKGELKEFLLVPYFGACIHSPPPPANQIVHVTSQHAAEGLAHDGRGVGQRHAEGGTRRHRHGCQRLPHRRPGGRALRAEAAALSPSTSPMPAPQHRPAARSARLGDAWPCWRLWRCCWPRSSNCGCTPLSHLGDERGRRISPRRALRHDPASEHEADRLRALPGRRRHGQPHAGSPCAAPGLAMSWFAAAAAADRTSAGRRARAFHPWATAAAGTWLKPARSRHAASRPAPAARRPARAPLDGAAPGPCPHRTDSPIMKSLNCLPWPCCWPHRWPRWPRAMPMCTASPRWTSPSKRRRSR